jgi:DNA-binding NarL/FixJ family response regulator
MRQPVRVVLADDHDAFVEGLGMVLSAEDDLEIVALAGDGASTLQAVSTHHPDVLVVDTEMPGPAVTELVRLVGQAEPGTRVLLLAEDARPGPSSDPDPDGPAGMSRAARATSWPRPSVPSPVPGRRGRPPAPIQPASRHPHPSGVTPNPVRSHPNPESVSPPSRQASPHPAVPAPEREGNRDAGRGLALSTARAVRGDGPGGLSGPGGPSRTLRPSGTSRPSRTCIAELLPRSPAPRERQILDLLARGYSNRRIAEACYLSLNTVRTQVQNVLVKLGVHSKLEAAALAVRQGLVHIEDYPA